ELAFIERQRALHNTRCNGARDAAPVFATLNHDGDDILWIIERSETGELGDRIFMAAFGGLRGTGLSSNLHIFQSRSSSCPAVFIDNLPKALADQINLVCRKLIAEICSHARPLGHHV